MDNSFEISLVYKDNDDFKIEKVDAIQLGEYYQLKAVPAFANNLAYNDIISVEEENGYLFFDKLIRPSGHSVVHLAILEPMSSNSIISSLLSLNLGLNYLHNNLYLVIDIPSHIDYSEVKQILEKEASLGNIDYKEACLSIEHKND